MAKTINLKIYCNAVIDLKTPVLLVLNHKSLIFLKNLPITRFFPQAQISFFSNPSKDSTINIVFRMFIISQVGIFSAGLVLDSVGVVNVWNFFKNPSCRV
jgi:hypothetical protein